MDLNNPTGTNGLLAIDKRGSHALFFDPTTFAAIDRQPLPARPHEVALSADHRLAYVSIYGSGVYGANPEPGKSIAVIHLASHQHLEDIEVAPMLAPHGLMLGNNGLLYASCDHSGVVAVVDCVRGQVVGTIDTGCTGPHQIVLLPDGSKLYSENEEFPFLSVMDPARMELVRKIEVPEGSAGITSTPDGTRVLVTDNTSPMLVVVDTASDTVVNRIRLEGHPAPAQRVRCSPDGRFVVVTSTEAPLITVLDSSLEHQTTFETTAAPMGVAFHPDGQTALVGNHGAGRITIVDLEAAAPRGDFAAGVGVETLVFY